MIIDCFPFHREMDMLEIHLNVLAPVIDFFVIVESDITHSGRPKGYLLPEQIGRFADFPVHYMQIKQDPGRSSWELEQEQREALKVAVEQLAHGPDFVIIGDLDEISNPDLVSAVGRTRSIRFHQRLFYFYLNAEQPAGWGGGTVMADGYEARLRSYNDLRSNADVTVPGGGWHFSSCFTEDGVVNKLGSFAHTEFQGREKEILDHRRALRDIHGNSLTVVEIDGSFPAYIRDNQDRYAHLICSSNV